MTRGQGSVKGRDFARRKEMTSGTTHRAQGGAKRKKGIMESNACNPSEAVCAHDGAKRGGFSCNAATFRGEILRCAQNDRLEVVRAQGSAKRKEDII